MHDVVGKFIFKHGPAIQNKLDLGDDVPQIGQTVSDESIIRIEIHVKPSQESQC
jgi:hypothetical protein